MRPWTNRTALLGFTGSLFLVIGTFLYLFSNLIFSTIIRNELPLTSNSRSYSVWQNTRDFPLYLNFYFFNWTNPQDLTVPGTKPKLEQLGPYSFREIKEKVNVTFHPENGTVSYLQRRFWFFDQSRSNGSLQDNITQLNVVAVSAVHMAARMPLFMQNSLSIVLTSTKTTLHVTKTVDELLFTGYNDVVIDIGRAAAEEDQSPPFDRFGWFYKRNGSTEFDGYVNMATGVNDINELGVMKQWNHKDTIKYYKSPCNTVEGSAGEFWPPYRTKEDINLFSADICRPLTYEFVDEVVHKNLKAYKFAIGKKTLSNDTMRRYPHEQAKYFEPTTTTEDFFESEPATSEPEEFYGDPDMVNVGHCYCNGKCSPMGLINITACRHGAPGFVSLPHFYKGDPVLVDQVEGLNPNEKDHDFYITLEPNTGIPIDVSARLQVNIMIQPSKLIAIFKDVPTMYFPVLWFSLQAGIPDDMAVSLGYLLMLPSFFFYTSIVLMSVGAVAAIVSAVMCYTQKRTDTSKRYKARNYELELNASNKKEVVYVDKNLNDDGQVRGSRHLYPKI